MGGKGGYAWGLSAFGHSPMSFIQEELPEDTCGFITRKCVDGGLGGPGAGWPPGLAKPATQHDHQGSSYLCTVSGLTQKATVSAFA